MSKVCKQCREEKDLSEFYKCKRSRDGLRYECKKCNISNRRKWTTDRMDGRWYIYYLPEEHYCGQTSNLNYRIKKHGYEGKNTNNWRVLYSTKTKKEAIYYEALFCSTLGINGLKCR